MKSKSEIMRRIRIDRKTSGLVEVRLWVTPARKNRILKYLDYLDEISGGCFCEKQKHGVNGFSCGDCPRDYAAVYLSDV